MSTLPPSVIKHIRHIFLKANNRITRHFSNNPNVHETHLDQGLITAINEFGIPKKITYKGDWVVTFKVEFIGSHPLSGRLELADIGLTVIFSHKNKVNKVKSVLLQSKRLFADEEQDSEYVTTQQLVHGDSLEPLNRTRDFSFNESSTYRSLKNDNQLTVINDFTRNSKIPIYYLFYNPWELPLGITVPSTVLKKFHGRSVGARIVPSKIVTNLVSSTNKSPTYADVNDAFHNDQHVSKNGFIDKKAGWKLENFVVDLVLQCKEGYSTNRPRSDDYLQTMFFERTRPIAAAVTITIDTPETHQ